MKQPGLRRWATPLTIGAFVLMAGTGVLMFFGYDHGITTVVHQWLSWIFLGAVAAHLTVHVRSLRSHLGSRPGTASVITFACVLAVSCFAWGQTTGPQLKRSMEQALVDAPLAALAGVTRTSAEDLIARLRERGIVATPRSTIRELSERYDVGENRLAALVFKRAAPARAAVAGAAP